MGGLSTLVSDAMARYRGQSDNAAERVFDKVKMDCFASEDP